MRPQNVPLQFLVYLYPGASDEYWRLRANDGRLGPITAEPGKVRNRLCRTAEVERRYGARTDEQFADAFRRYEADHCIMRRSCAMKERTD